MQGQRGFRRGKVIFRFKISRRPQVPFWSWLGSNGPQSMKDGSIHIVELKSLASLDLAIWVVDNVTSTLQIATTKFLPKFGQSSRWLKVN